MRVSPPQRRLLVRQPTRRALWRALTGFAAIGLVALAFFVGAALPEGYGDELRRRPQVVFGWLSDARLIAVAGLASDAEAPVIALVAAVIAAVVLSGLLFVAVSLLALLDWASPPGRRLYRRLLSAACVGGLLVALGGVVTLIALILCERA